MQKNIFIGYLSSAIEAQSGSLFVFLIPFLMPKIIAGEAPLFFGNAIMLFGLFCFPFGSLLFGTMGDALGRKPTLLITSLGLGLANVIVACTPLNWQYGSLVFLAVGYGLQTFCSGGEYSGATIYAQEHSPIAGRDKVSGFSCAAAAMGLFSSTIFVLLVEHLPHHIHLWRLGFVLGSVAILVSACLKYYGEETPSYRPFHAVSWTTLLKEHYGSMLYVTLLTTCFGSLYYMAFVVIPQQAFTEHHAVMGYENAIAMGLYVVLLAVGGLLANNLGGSRLMRLVATIGATALLTLMLLGEWEHMRTLQITLVLMTAFFAAPIHSVALSSFPDMGRCRAIGLAFAVGWTISGFIVFMGYNIYSIAYLIVLLALSAICLAWLSAPKVEFA